jgi:hypothetical protein
MISSRNGELGCTEVLIPILAAFFGRTPVYLIVYRLASRNSSVLLFKSIISSLKSFALIEVWK